MRDKTIIQLKKTFPHPVALVFSTFLDEAHFRNWFSPPGFNVKDVSLNPVKGGEYKCELEKTDGMKLVIKGIYKEIVTNEKISFSFLYEPDMSSIGESSVTVTFNGSGNNTEIVLLQEIYKDISTEGRTKGWEYMLGRLEEIIASN